MPLSYPQTATGFTWLDAPFGPALQSDVLEGFHHLFTTRALALRGQRADDDWAALERAMGIAPGRLFAPKQVHGADVLVVSANDRAPRSLNDTERPLADIVMTDDCESALAVQVADCVPLLIADRRTGAVAAAHAGWRGTAQNVVIRAVAGLASRYGSRPADLVVAVGPSIRSCCYQVGPDVRAAFVAAGCASDAIARWFVAEPQGDRFRLDVARANREQLVSAGIAVDSISDCGLCTSCHPDVFFSYRRDGAGTGRLAAAIKPAQVARDSAPPPR